MPTKTIFGDDGKPINSKKKSQKIIDMNLSDLVVDTSKIYEEKYNSYFVTKGRVNLDIIENNLLSSVKEFQLYQFLHAIDNNKDIINIKYANFQVVYLIGEGR